MRNLYLILSVSAITAATIELSGLAFSSGKRESPIVPIVYHHSPRFLDSDDYEANLTAPIYLEWKHEISFPHRGDKPLHDYDKEVVASRLHSFWRALGESDLSGVQAALAETTGINRWDLANSVVFNFKETVLPDSGARHVKYSYVPALTKAIDQGQVEIATALLKANAAYYKPSLVAEFTDLRETYAAPERLKWHVPLAVYHGQQHTPLTRAVSKPGLPTTTRIALVKLLLNEASDARPHNAKFATDYSGGSRFKTCTSVLEFSPLQLAVRAIESGTDTDGCLAPSNVAEIKNTGILVHILEGADSRRPLR
ncbi:MAG TPA: hypothetical protein VJJ83_01870 [Candidatus Babeliales bacterium]|nr:hypothetical protein [Candidatus Babeliales bacterium]